MIGPLDDCSVSPTLVSPATARTAGPPTCPSSPEPQPQARPPASARLCANPASTALAWATTAIGNGTVDHAPVPLPRMPQ